MAEPHGPTSPIKRQRADSPGHALPPFRPIPRRLSESETLPHCFPRSHPRVIQIHMDRKSSDKDRADVRELLHGLDNARMLEPAQSVSWGGFSITLTALFGLSTLVEWSQDWDFFINLRCFVWLLCLCCRRRPRCRYCLGFLRLLFFAGILLWLALSCGFLTAAVRGARGARRERVADVEDTRFASGRWSRAGGEHVQAGGRTCVCRGAAGGLVMKIHLFTGGRKDGRPWPRFSLSTRPDSPPLGATERTLTERLRTTTRLVRGMRGGMGRLKRLGSCSLREYRLSVGPNPEPRSTASTRTRNGIAFARAVGSWSPAGGPPLGSRLPLLRTRARGRLCRSELA